MLQLRCAIDIYRESNIHSQPHKIAAKYASPQKQRMAATAQPGQGHSTGSIAASQHNRPAKLSRALESTIPQFCAINNRTAAVAEPLILRPVELKLFSHLFSEQDVTARKE
ncbi:MAG TPA: hypothetical protein VLC91_09250 [Spongiibacteraceae bacterium]|nr:hypothetical protein [Spongiibacteraceae bacterium]